MTEKEFKTLKNFSPLEADLSGRLIIGKRKRIVPELMYCADYTVSLVKRYHPDVIFIVVDINRGEHTDGSFHYSGKAIDGFFYDTKRKMILPLPMQYYYMTLGGFKGIGVYPEHKQPKVHGDIREQKHLSVWYAYYDTVIENGKEVRIQNYEYNRLKIAKVLEICEF